MDAKETDNDAARRFAGKVVELEFELTAAQDSGSHWFNELTKKNSILTLKQMQLDYESGEHKRLSIENAREREKSNRLLVKVNKLMEALIWCSASDDFAPGGQAREGWLKIQKDLLTGTEQNP